MYLFVYFSFDVLVALAAVHIDCFAHKAYGFITECLFPHSFEMTVFALNKLPLRTFPSVTDHNKTEHQIAARKNKLS